MKYFEKPRIKGGRVTALFLAVFILSCSLLGTFTPYLTPEVSAVGVDQQSLTVAGKDISCYIKVNSSQNVEDLSNKLFKRGDSKKGDNEEDNGSQALYNVANDSKTPKQAASDLNAVLNGAARVSLSFDSQDSPSSGPCKQAAIFVQSAVNNKQFYGVLYTGSSTHGGGRAGSIKDYNYTYISATVNTTTHKASFSTGHPAMTISGYDAKYFPGGAGGITAGSSTCPKFSSAKDAATTQICINAFGAPEFFDFATINYGGGTFKLDKWTGSSMRYNLTSSSSDPAWVTAGNTHLDLKTDSGLPGGYDINLDNGKSDLHKQLGEFKKYLEGAGGKKVNLQFTNMGVSQTRPDNGKNLTANKADLSAIKYVAYYYPNNGKPEVVTAATDGGSNEKNYIGTYDKIDATTFRDGQATSSGCKSDATRPAFVFTSDPSKAALNSVVNATWKMPDQNCATTNVNVQIQVLGKDVAPPSIKTGSGSNQAAADGQTCESSAGPLGWIMCIIIDTLADAVNGIYTEFIVPMLQTPSLSASSGQGAALFKAWSAFRVFGNIFLIIVVLIVVFGESIGGGMMDAYTIKKILPRILIGAIMINLSYYACALFIDFANIIGNGLRLLLTGAFGLNGNDFNLKTVNGAAQGGFLGISTAGIGVAIAAIDGPAIVAGFIALIFTILPMLLLLFISIIAVLALRLGLIYALILASPVAFALWVLPNTEKFFKKWFELLQTTAMVFPIISGLFGLSMILAQSTLWATGSKGALGGAVGYFLSIIIVVMPLVLIPFAFKLAGGILGRAYELASNGRSMGNNWLKKRGELRKQRMQNGTFFNPSGRLGNTRLGDYANKQLQRNAVRAVNENDEARGSRFGRPSEQRKILDDAVMSRKAAHREAYVKQMKELYGGDENKIQAAMNAYDDKGNFNANTFRANLRAHNVAGQPPKYTEADIEQAVTKVQRTRTQMGNTAFALASSQAYLSNGTVNNDANEEAMRWIHNATHGDKQAGINMMLAAADEAKAAGRVDLFSSSPSDNIKAYLHETGEQRSAEIDAAGGTTKWLLERAKATRSPGELAMMKGDGIERMAPLMVDDVKAQQRLVVQSTEHSTEQAARQVMQQAEQVLTTYSNNRQAVAVQVENARAQVTFGGTATPAQQKAIDDALQAQRDVEIEYQRAQGDYQIKAGVHGAARDALESTAAHKELMHQLARVKGMEDIAGQIPDGKAKAYVETAFAAKGVVDVDASGNDVLGDDSLSKLYNSREVTSNDTFRMYHKEYTDAESLRSVAAQAAAAAAAAAGAAGAPPGAPGAPGAGPGTPSDRRLKRNISYLQTTRQNIKLYRFQYLWSDQVYVGVMAQDLVHTHPETLSRDTFGFYSVNYEMLGLQMVTLEQWREASHALDIQNK